LSMVKVLGGKLPAKILLIGCEPASWTEVMGLSAEVEAAIPGAVEMVESAVRSLLAEVRPQMEFEEGRLA
jgi:hypothetical protein